MRSLLLAVFVMAASTTVARTAAACSCMQPPPPQQALADAAHVFEGEIMSLTQPAQGSIAATVRVLRAWKGVTEPEVVVHTAENSAACGLSFAQGQRWLLYTGVQDNKTHASLCSRSAPSESAAQDITALGAPVFTPTPEPAPVPPPAEPTPPPETPPPEPQSGGCAGCTSAPVSTAPAWWLVALALCASRLRDRLASRNERR